MEYVALKRRNMLTFESSQTRKVRRLPKVAHVQGSVELILTSPILHAENFHVQARLGVCAEQTCFLGIEHKFVFELYSIYPSHP